MKSISYAITVKDELKEIQNLLPLLSKYCRKEDEIVILWDSSGSDEVWSYLEDAKFGQENFEGLFQGDFSKIKNHLNSLTCKDFIFNIDADEIPCNILLEYLPQILDSNDCEAYWIPRENYVQGLTQEWISKWGWRVDEKQRINYPDKQLRVFKRDPERIKWVNKVHEQLTGYKTVSELPEELYLLHNKTIERQIKQNQFYENI